MDFSGKLRCAFYSHDTMGFGHIRRNMLLSQAVLQACPKAEILLISGVREAGRFTLPQGADTLVLPSYFKTPEGKYLPRSLGKKIKPLVQLRAQIIYAALNSFSPDILVVDNVPRGAMRELDISLPMLAKKKTHLVLGLRDILDEPAAVKKQWDKQENMSAIREYYSTVWVYGDRKLYDLRKEYHFDAATSRKIKFTGYLDATRRNQDRSRNEIMMPDGHRPYVLCVVGGGQDGFALAESFACARLPDGMDGILVTGSMMPPSERLRLHEIAARFPEKKVVEFVPEPLQLLRHASCVVAMGGYNTVTEILAFQKAALIVPRVSPRQEQWIRALRLAQAGLLDCVHPDNLSPAFLSDWLAQRHSFADPRKTVDFDGLQHVADSVREIITGRAMESETCR